MSGAPTEQERVQARQLWADLGRPEMAEPTPEQLLAFLRRCPDSVGLDYASRWIETRREEARCHMADHDGQIAAHPAELAAQRQQIADLLRTVAAGRREYLIRNPGANQAIERSNAILEGEALTLEAAAKIAEGDTDPLYGLLPSWRWTDEMQRVLFRGEA